MAESKAERIAEVLSFAQRMREYGTVYERIPKVALTKVQQNFVVTEQPKKVHETEAAIDMNQTYGL